MDEQGLVKGIREYMAQLYDEGRFSTAKSYQDALNSFVRYCGTEHIPYVALNKENLRRYEAYLLERGSSRNTISTYMRRLRCVYNRAVDNGKAEYVPNLFRDVFTGIESRRKRSLSLEDQHRLMTAKVGDGELRKIQLAICLMYQYGGMPFVDFAHLRPVNIKKGMLDYKRQKTSTPIRMELLETEERMRKELAGDNLDTNGYLYPFLSGCKEGYGEYKEYNRALLKFNRSLRTLRKTVGIEADVTSYTIRHSFAMALKEQDVPVEMISELLGHKSIKTTQIYLRSFSLKRQTEVNLACFQGVYNYIPDGRGLKNRMLLGR